MYKLYKSQYNPDNLTGQVGGTIGSAALSGYLGELFYIVSAPPSGLNQSAFQYRKVFIRNEFTKESTSTKVWLQDAEHPEQISIASSSSISDSSPTPTGQPAGVTGWTNPTSFASGLVIGTLAPNAFTGFWIRQTLSGVTQPDPYATFNLYVGGIV